MDVGLRGQMTRRIERGKAEQIKAFYAKVCTSQNKTTTCVPNRNFACYDSLRSDYEIPKRGEWKIAHRVTRSTEALP
jgi:hypothetical protein